MESKMNILEQIKDLISIEQKSSNSFRIHLPVLYADGENVCVDIIENKSSYFISDNGFGLENAFAQVDNISTSDIERIGKSVSKTYGLNISKKYTIQELNKLKIKPENNNKDNGIVYLNDVSINELNGAIMMVANASKVFSHKLVEDNIIAEELSLKERLEDKLKYIYKNSFDKYVKKDVSMTGMSTKLYKITFVVENNNIRDGKRLLEPVSDRINSISPLYLKYSDIQKENISKEALISDLKDWNAGSLELIKNVSNQVYRIEDFAA